MVLNAMYIIPNFCRTTLQCDHAIGPKINHLKYTFIQGFIFEGTIIIQHEFISNFIFVVQYFNIFVDVIFINLYLLYLNHVTDKLGAPKSWKSSGCQNQIG